MTGRTPNIDRARAYLRAIEARDGSELTYYASDAIQRELPNRLLPAGATRDLAALRQASERGRGVVTSQQFEILNAIEQGPEVALELIWTATLAVPVGSLAAGATMRAHFGLFMTFRDGLIISQRNYDCFEPF
jgi:ketosteroid isomerase-like protein